MICYSYLYIWTIEHPTSLQSSIISVLKKAYKIICYILPDSRSVYALFYFTLSCFNKNCTFFLAAAHEVLFSVFVVAALVYFGCTCKLFEWAHGKQPLPVVRTRVWYYILVLQHLLTSKYCLQIPTVFLRCFNSVHTFT